MKQLKNSDKTMGTKKHLKNKINLRKIVTLFLVLIGVSYVNAKECEGFYVTNNLDTIKCKINIEENFFHKNVYHFHRISRGVKLKDTEGVKFFRPQEIACFVVFVPSGDTCKFVSVQTDNHYFYHEVAAGKIFMYLKYQTHPYDGGMITECIFFKNDEPIKLRTMDTRKIKEKKSAFFCQTILKCWKNGKRQSSI
ncbi:MAG: hypothetical protein PUB21_10955 [Bacteroidales bacterium]|nr:hypothetical protein [Bacteroidales bacterium]